jgi:hypothetical protein
MRHCLWRKRNQDVQTKGSALVPWNKICRPKDQGGLGVLNPNTQKNALFLKNLHKFFNKHDIPWVNLIWSKYYFNGSLPGSRMEGSFLWKAHLKLVDIFKAMARCNLGDGTSVSFWMDLWQDRCLHQQLPHLLSFAKKTVGTVHGVVTTEFLEYLFHLPPSQQAQTEFCQSANASMIPGITFGEVLNFQQRKHIWS